MGDKDSKLSMSQMLAGYERGAQLLAFCRGKLGGFKLPKELVLRETLPRLPSGKVLKRVLRTELTSAPHRSST